MFHVMQEIVFRSIFLIFLRFYDVIVCVWCIIYDVIHVYEWKQMNLTTMCMWSPCGVHMESFCVPGHVKPNGTSSAYVTDLNITTAPYPLHPLHPPQPPCHPLFSSSCFAS